MEDELEDLTRERNELIRRMNDLSDKYEDYVSTMNRERIEIMRKNKNQYSLLFMNAHETGFLYAKSCFWNNELMSKLLTSIKKPAKLPLLIKLTSDNRRIGENAIKNKDYIPGSLMYELMEE